MDEFTVTLTAEELSLLRLAVAARRRYWEQDPSEWINDDSVAQARYSDLSNKLYDKLLEAEGFDKLPD